MYFFIKGSAQKYTQFTGNMQPCSTKECVLIYDTKTNEFTLERLQTNFMLKKSRFVKFLSKLIDYSDYNFSKK